MNIKNVHAHKHTSKKDNLQNERKNLQIIYIYVCEYIYISRDLYLEYKEYL